MGLCSLRSATARKRVDDCSHASPSIGRDREIRHTSIAHLVTREPRTRGSVHTLLMQLLAWLCVLASVGRSAAYAHVGCAAALRPPLRRAASGVAMAAHSRRDALIGGFSALALGLAPANAADGKLWLSGKSDPIRPTSKEKPDGTKKDNRYISCLNDCVPRKQGPPGPGQKDRADCLDTCQQECCFTYEQCTYSIRK